MDLDGGQGTGNENGFCTIPARERRRRGQQDSENGEEGVEPETVRRFGEGDQVDNPPCVAPLSFWQSGRQELTALTRDFASQPCGWFAFIEESFLFRTFCF